MKKIKKFLKWVSIIFVLLAISIAGLTYAYSDKIEKLIIDKLNSSLKESVLFDSMHFSLIDKFPQASVEFRNVRSQGTIKNSCPLLNVQHIYLAFNWYDIFADDISVEQIDIEGGTVCITKDGKENWNYEIFHTDSTKSKSSNAFQIKEFNLINVLVKYTNLVEESNYSYYSSNSKIKINVTNQTSLIATLDGLVQEIKLSNFHLNKEIPISGGLDLVVGDSVNFSLSNGKINNQAINLFGSVGEKLVLNYEFIGADLLSLVQIMPTEYIDFALWDKAKGKINSKGVLQTNKDDYSLNATFNFSNVFLKLSNDYPISNGQFSGSLNWAKLSSLNTLNINFKNYAFQISKSTFIGNLLIKNMAYPNLEGTVKSDIDLQNWIHTIPDNTLKTLTGKCSFDAKFNGKLNYQKKEIDWLTELSKFSTSGEINIAGIDLQVDEKSQLFKNLNGELSFNNNHIIIKNLSGAVNSTNFELKGEILNYIKTLLSDYPLNIDASLTANQIILEEFITDDNQPESSAAKEDPYFFDLPDYICLNVDLNLKSFTFRKLDIKNITGQVSVKNKLLEIKNLYANTCEGKAFINGSLNTSVKDKILYQCKADLQQMDIKKVFYQLENFGQDFLLDKHINGTLNTVINFMGESDKYLNINLNKVYTNADIELLNGSLIDFEPLIELQDFLKSEFFLSFDLKNLQFSTLKNTIEIINQKIFIPEMDIKSSAMDLNFSGTHTFDQDISYLFKIKHSEIFKAKRQNPIDSKFGVIEEDGNSAILPLLMSGNVDDPKFSYDFKTKKSLIKESVQEEKKDVLEAIKKERQSWNKQVQDSLRQQEQNKKTQFQVEWDE